MTKTTEAMSRQQRLAAGDRAPPFRAASVKGAEVLLPDQANLTHLQFLRFAGCPVCNLHVQSFIRRHDEVRAAGVREVCLFHSEARFIEDYYGALPFPLIADPQRDIYKRYRIETSPWAILSPRALPGLIQGYRLKRAGVFDSTRFGLPADFLIDTDGVIVACHYGSHSSDQWTVDELLALARQSERAGATLRMARGMP